MQTKPFFARLLENEKAAELPVQTAQTAGAAKTDKWPSDNDDYETMTLKYPSDGDEPRF